MYLRQVDGKGRAEAGACAVRLDASAVQVHDVPRDREAEPEAAVQARGGRVRLAEAIEHRGQEVRVDADAGVAHGHYHLIVLLPHVDFDVAIAWRELHGIREQVPEDL